MFKNYLIVFLVSMVPIIELRGAVPIGIGMGLPIAALYAASASIPFFSDFISGTVTALSSALNDIFVRLNLAWYIQDLYYHRIIL